MSFKRESPGRPPPPKGIGKKTDSSPSMKFSFKNLEKDEDEEEDLTILTGELTKKVESEKLKTVSKPPESPKKILDSKSKENDVTNSQVDDDKTVNTDSKKFVPSQRSWDSPTLPRQATKSEPIPSRSSSDNKLQKYSKSVEEEGSALSWFKQNVAEISSVVKDKAEKAKKRIEEFSENIGKDEETKGKDGKPFRQEDFTRLKKDDDHVVKKEEVETLKSVPMVTKKEDSKMGITVDDVEQVQEAEDEEEFNIIEDFYTNEPHEDFTGIPSVTRVDSHPVTKTSLKRRFVKGKAPKPKTPISMSKLSKDKVDELEESANVFFDAKDVSAEVSMTTKQLDEKTTLNNLKENVEKNVPSKKFVGIICGIFIYIIIPLPAYLSGMVLGSFLASLGWMLYIFLTKPSDSKVPEKLIPLKEMPPMVEPEIKDVSLDDGVNVHKGWMNEITEYNQETYHINNTHSVHVYLDGIILRLRSPKNGVPKRAMWNEEPIKSVEFVHQRYFNLEGSHVFLQPEGLVKKRVWSKKYPICIALKKKGRKEVTKSQETLPESDQGFEILDEESCDPSVLYLFARTCREKEEWFKKFEAASKGVPLTHHLVEVKKFFVNRLANRITTSNTTTSLPDMVQKRPGSAQSDSAPQHKRHGSTDSISSNSSNSSSPVTEMPDNSVFDMQEFVRFMGKTMPKEYYSCFLSPYKRNPIENKDSMYMIDCEQQLLWINAFISRCSWDFLHQKYWADKVMDKLQKKLDKIHIPYFIEAFKITDIHMGQEMPVIRRAARPYLDNQGFWIDLDVNYGGGFNMTIETKVNLMRLKQVAKESAEGKEAKEKHKKSAVTDSEEEDSAESSTDEEEEILAQGTEDSSQPTSGKRRFMRYLKKITESKYFQSATDMKYVKRAMEEVSNTALVLTVELRFLSGTLAINIPPPPTDRVWYGFRGNPKLTLVAKPKVGERRVTVSHITEFIEKKLSIEFQRVLVMPNLDDFVIPLLLPEYKNADPVMVPPASAHLPKNLSTGSQLSTQSNPL